MEVYQDQVRDLLINPNEDGTTRMPAIDVRESPTQGVFLEGVRYLTMMLLGIQVSACCCTCLLKSRHHPKFLPTECCCYLVTPLGLVVVMHPRRINRNSMMTYIDCKVFLCCTCCSRVILKIILQISLTI